MKTLTLNLKGVYFDAIKSGSKKFEYRLNKPFWQKRLKDREYDQIVICKGYPAKGDTENRITRDWNGYEMQTIAHEHFGSQPVDVFAIRVN